MKFIPAKKPLTLLLLLLICFQGYARNTFHAPNDPRIRYMGRIDFSNPLEPMMWASAAQVSFTFTGSVCRVIISDEIRWGKDHNFIDIIVDGKYNRIKLTRQRDTIALAINPALSVHKAIISKSTEATIGYIRFEGVICKKLVKPDAKPSRKIEFFGDSITSAMGSDTSWSRCKQGDWYDQTNAWMGYAATTGRALNAQYHVTSVSGIGMVHSCCNMNIKMPEVYDKISLVENKIPWNFKAFQPDVVCICLGQNDGQQDSTLFCGEYVAFIKKLRVQYPSATFILLSSPMADAALLAQMKRYLPAIITTSGEKKCYDYYFSRQSIGGCDYHPTMEEQQQIASELTAFIETKKIF